MSGRYRNGKLYLNDFNVDFRARDLTEFVKDDKGRIVQDDKGRDLFTIVAPAEPAIEVIDRLVGEISGREKLVDAVPGIDKRFILYFRDINYISPPFEQEKSDEEAEFNINAVFSAMQKPKGVNILFEPTGIFYNQGECLLRIRTHHGDKLELGDDLIFDIREFRAVLSELVNYKQKAHESQSMPYGPVAKVRVMPGLPSWYEWESGKPKHRLEGLAIRTEEFDDDALRTIFQDSLNWDTK